MQWTIDHLSRTTDIILILKKKNNNKKGTAPCISSDLTTAFVLAVPAACTEGEKNTFFDSYAIKLFIFYLFACQFCPRQ